MDAQEQRRQIFLQGLQRLLDQYLAAARNVAVMAVGNPSARPAGTPYVNNEGGKQLTHVEGLPLGTRGGAVIEHYFPSDGTYVLNIGDIANGLAPSGLEHKNTLIATLDGKVVGRTSRPFTVAHAAVTTPVAGPAPSTTMSAGTRERITFAAPIEAFDKDAVLESRVIGFFVDRMNMVGQIGRASCRERV